MGEGVFIHAPSTTFPTKAGSQRAVFSLCVRVWVPAFAGKTEVKTRPPSSLRATSPRGGRFAHLRSSPSGGSTGVAGVGGFFILEKQGPHLGPHPLPCSPRRRGPRPVHSDGERPAGILFCGNLAERTVDEHPPLPTLSPSRGGKGFLIRALAGNAGERKQGPLRRFAPLPPLGEVPAQPG